MYILGLDEAIKTAVLPVEKLAENVFQKLRLKEKPFSIFQVANDDDIDTLWEDPSLTREDTSVTSMRGTVAKFSDNSLPSTSLYVFNQKVHNLLYTTVATKHICKSSSFT